MVMTGSPSLLMKAAASSARSRRISPAAAAVLLLLSAAVASGAGAASASASAAAAFLPYRGTARVIISQRRQVVAAERRGRGAFGGAFGFRQRNGAHPPSSSMALRASPILAPSFGSALVGGTAVGGGNPHLLLSAAAEGGGGESWRQYVALGVIGMVLVDILLGSPFANKVLSFARPPSEDDDDDGDRFEKSKGGEDTYQMVSEIFQGSGKKQQPHLSGSGGKKRERIDVDSFAKAAIERAEGVTELREYLDSQKTDWDRMEELKRKMDDQMERLDEKRGIGDDED